MAPVVAIHDQLMSSAHKFEAVSLVELLTYVLAEGVAGTSWGDAPAHALVWV